MTAFKFHSSNPDNWVMPRSHLHPHERRLHYGPLQPMEGPSLLKRLFGMNRRERT